MTRNAPKEDLRACFVATDCSGRDLKGCNIVDALFSIAHSLDGVARAILDLGNADASTPMGAIEAFGLVMKHGLQQVAESIESINQSD